MDKQKKDMDYRAFFILGVSLMAVGISLMSVRLAFLAFLGFGVVFRIIGLANRDKGSKSKKET